MAEHGVELNTSDITPPEEADYVIYLEVPRKLPMAADRAKSFLVLEETPVVVPGNWNRADHAAFAKVFTYLDDYVDNKTYFKLNLCRAFPGEIADDISEKTKLMCLIAGNKSSSHPNELYSARIKAVRWFEENHPDEFDLYGMGWDKRVFHGLIRPLNRMHWVGRCLAPHYPSYRGPVASKIDVLRHYKFTLAFENGQGMNGYVTGDKIFDAMCAGSIPVYWGASNVTDYVPKDCFVDWREFGNWPDLYRFMTTMSEKQHKQFIRNMSDYITKAAIDGPFSDHAYARIMIREVLGHPAGR